MFEVTVEYTGIQIKKVDPEEPFSPNFSLSTGVQTGQEPIHYDIDGNVIANSAGDIFSDPVIAETETSNFSITRTEYVNPISKQREYSDRYGIVNETAIWGYRARTLRLTITSSYSIQSGWDVTYNFLYKSETWDYTTLDRGFDELIASDPQQPGVRIKSPILVDDNGSPVPITSPAALDGNGKRTANELAAKLSFVRCAERDFTLLGLPNIDQV